MLQDLIAQRAELDAKIAEAQREAKAGAIDAVKSLMAERGVTLADLSGKPAIVSKGAALKGMSVAPKYKAPTGETWTGRGLQPRWLKAALANGATLDQFKIAA